MKSILIVIALVVSVLTISSCQKDITGEIIGGTDSTVTTGPDTINNSFLVKTYTEDLTTAAGDHYSGTFNLTYDTDGRIISMLSTASAGDRFVYKYNSDNTYTMDLFNANVLSIHGVFYINSINRVDSSMQYNDTQDTTTGKFIYDVAGFLTQQKEYEISEGVTTLINTTNYTYDNTKNNIVETDKDSETKYEYYTDLPNNLSLGMVYFQRNANLPKTTTITGEATLSHTYTFDSLKRVTSEKVTATTGDVLIRSYTY